MIATESTAEARRTAAARILAAANAPAASRILILDDDRDLLRLLEQAFTHAGYEVAAESDALRLPEILASGSFAAVVLDVMMPGRSGWQVLADLRKDARTVSLPILMLSAAGDSANRVKGLRLGADDFLAKPFDPDEIVARVERSIARHAGAQTSLEGSLAALAAGDVAQTIAQNRQSGRLVLATAGQAGWVEFAAGQVCHAHFGNLDPVEAALELLRWHQGRFHFEPSRAESAAPDLAAAPPARRVEELLLEAAWIDDEVASREAQLPALDERLSASGSPLPAESGELPSLPLVAVVERVAGAPGLSLGELLALELAAPQRIRLATAVLLAAGALRRELRPQELAAATAATAARPVRHRFHDGSERALPLLPDEVPYPEGRLIVSRADPEGNITQVNDSLCEIAGYSREELLGQPHSILRHPDMPRTVFRELWSTLENGEVWHGYIKNRCKDGRFYWVYATVIPNRRQGRIVGYTSVRREPSRAKVYEAEARHSHQV